MKKKGKKKKHNKIVLLARSKVNASSELKHDADRKNRFFSNGADYGYIKL